MAPRCPQCGGVDSESYENSLICLTCGWVLEESNIVVEQTFSETAGGSSVADGQFVSATGSSFRGVRGVNRESREITLENARRRISNLAGALTGLTSHHVESAFRLFLLALQHNFVRGRKSDYVVSSCLYVVCRRERTSHMLIDFADVLNVPLYYLGHTFLDFCSLLNLQLPVIDPSLYIERFASKLGLGDKTPQVANTALRLVQRMNRDWITTGRRPAGICGAALVVAARIHGFKREVDQVVRVVRICDVTIKKRLFEFEKTGASSLTPAEFEVVELEMEMDPPCYTKGQQRERERQRKRKAIELARRRDEEEAAAAAGQDEEEEGATTGKRARAGTHSLSEEEEVESGFCGRASRTNGEAGEEQEGSVDRSQELGGGKGKEKEGEGRASEGITQEMQEKMREIMQDSAIRQLDADLNHRAIEESDYSDGPTSTQHQPPSSASSSSSFNFTSQSDFLEGGDPYYWEEVDDGGKLEELDDDELDGYLRTPDEAKLTAVVWEEMNKDWLIANEEKKKQEALKWPNGKPTSTRRKGRRAAGSKVVAATAAEAVASTLAKKTSAKINYERLKEILSESTIAAAKEHEPETVGNETHLDEYDDFDDFYD